MKSPKLLSVLALGVCIAVPGCRRSTEPALSIASPAPRVLGLSDPWPTGAQHALRLTTSVRSATHTALSGGDIPLVLSVTNHESGPVTLYFASGCKLLFEVRDVRGARVSPSWGCTDNPTSLTLQPGETRESSTIWRAARYDYPTGLYVPLPAGRYAVRAFLAGRDPYESRPFMVQLAGG